MLYNNFAPWPRTLDNWTSECFQRNGSFFVNELIVYFIRHFTMAAKVQQRAFYVPRISYEPVFQPKHLETATDSCFQTRTRARNDHLINSRAALCESSVFWWRVESRKRTEWEIHAGLSDVSVYLFMEYTRSPFVFPLNCGLFLLVVKSRHNYSKSLRLQTREDGVSALVEFNWTRWLMSRFIMQRLSRPLRLKSSLWKNSSISVDIETLECSIRHTLGAWDTSVAEQQRVF